MTDFHKLWEELNESEKDEFGDETNYLDFQNYMNNDDGVLIEMGNVRGNDIKVANRLPFSLFISSKEAVHEAHGIRVKVLWNPNKMTSTPDGQLELHGDYEYKVFSHKYKPTAKELQTLKDFCKQYKVFFSAIWEGRLDATDFVHYLEGLITYPELVSSFDLKGKDYYLVNHCKDVFELEHCVRDNKIFSMND